jgi:DNA modification methylase
MEVKNQVITDRYAIYNDDVMNVITKLEDESIDLSVYSPPFGALYTYSSDPRDMSNVSSDEEFLTHYEFLVKEMSRITKSGRVNAIHCTDLFKNNGQLSDFPHEIIKLYEKHGFTYMSRITIWKEPLKVRIKTMVQSLMHKYIVEDSTKCYPAMPDYILLFRKKGENKVPVTHPVGIEEYHGEIPILPNMLKAWNNQNDTNFTADELWDYLKRQNQDDKITKLNHYVWQRYASAIWDDIRVENCLPFQDAREEDDEKHITPTQLDVIDRIVELYSNPEEVVFTPFMGVGSEVFSPVSMGRKAIGIELKDSYFKQAVKNMQDAETRYAKKFTQASLF